MIIDVFRLLIIDVLSTVIHVLKVMGIIHLFQSQLKQVEVVTLQEVCYCVQQVVKELMGVLLHVVVKQF